jgi:hypothetical protein
VHATCASPTLNALGVPESVATTPLKTIASAPGDFDVEASAVVLQHLSDHIVVIINTDVMAINARVLFIAITDLRHMATSKGGFTTGLPVNSPVQRGKA